MHHTGPSPLIFKGPKQGFGGKNCQKASRGKPSFIFFFSFQVVITLLLSYIILVSLFISVFLCALLSITPMATRQWNTSIFDNIENLYCISSEYIDMFFDTVKIITYTCTDRLSI